MIKTISMSIRVSGEKVIRENKENKDKKENY